MKFLYRLFKHDSHARQRILELEKRITRLEIELKENKKDFSPSDVSKKEEDVQPTVKIEHLQIDKIIIEKLDYVNNFGQLGIKELSGKLNIGTSYEGDLSKEVKEKLNEKLGPQAKVNLRAKKEA
jgi:hypothetical protein